MLKVIEKQDNVATAGTCCLSNMGARVGRVAFGDISHLYVKASELARTVETKLDVILLEIWEVSKRYA
jgi:hypothetical protein